MNSQHQRYVTLQIRTILYGLLAMTVGMYIAAWIAIHFGATPLQAIAIGGAIGCILTQATCLIVRALNPL